MLYCQNPNCKKILTGDQRKYCCHPCSAKITSKGRKHSLESRIKCSLTLGGKGNIIENDSLCLNCNNKINRPKKYCNLFCHGEYKYKTLVNQWLKEPEKFTYPRSFMKKWLIRTFGEKCSICGWCQVNPKTNRIPIELHHHDGNWKHNDPKNICLLCPNCHSLTPTYRFGNRGNGREVQREYYRGKTTKK